MCELNALYWAAFEAEKVSHAYTHTRWSMYLTVFLTKTPQETVVCITDKVQQAKLGYNGIVEREDNYYNRCNIKQ